METKPKEAETVTLHTKEEDITFSNLGLAPDENCVLPFHMDIAGIDLITASAQPVTVLRHKSPSGERPIFVFLKPDGMEPVFHFETEAVTDQESSIYRCDPQKQAEVFHVSKNGSSEDRQAALSAERSSVWTEL